MKALLSIIVLLACASATFAEEPRWYVGGNISMWSDATTSVLGTPVDIDMGTGYGFVFGVDMEDWRWGVEFGAIDAAVSYGPGFSEPLDVATIMFSATKSWDLNVKDLDFYLGGGIGMQGVENVDGDTDSGITGLIRTGLEYSMGNGRLGFGYKYQFFDDVDYGNGISWDAPNVGALEISYRYLF